MIDKTAEIKDSTNLEWWELKEIQNDSFYHYWQSQDFLIWLKLAEEKTITSS